MAMRNFWFDSQIKKCKCGKKEVVHGSCQECWDNGDKEKAIEATKKEYAELHDERKEDHKNHLRMLMGG